MENMLEWDPGAQVSLKEEVVHRSSGKKRWVGFTSEKTKQTSSVWLILGLGREAILCKISKIQCRVC